MRKILLFFLIILSSCSSRKVLLQKKEKQTNISEKQVDKTEIKRDIELYNVVLEKKDTEAYSYEFKPIDSSKAMIINGNEYVNVNLISTKKTEKTEKKESLKQLDNSIIEQHNNYEKKIKQKEAFNDKLIDKQVRFNWLFCLLLIIPIYIGYRYFTRR